MGKGWNQQSSDYKTSSQPLSDSLPDGDCGSGENQKISKGFLCENRKITKGSLVN